MQCGCAPNKLGQNIAEAPWPPITDVSQLVYEAASILCSEQTHKTFSVVWGPLGPSWTLSAIVNSDASDWVSCGCRRHTRCYWPAWTSIWTTWVNWLTTSLSLSSAPTTTTAADYNACWVARWSRWEDIWRREWERLGIRWVTVHLLVSPVHAVSTRHCEGPSFRRSVQAASSISTNKHSMCSTPTRPTSFHSLSDFWRRTIFYNWTLHWLKLHCLLQIITLNISPYSFRTYLYTHTGWPKKVSRKLLSISSPNIEFHQHFCKKILLKVITK